LTWCHKRNSACAAKQLRLELIDSDGASLGSLAITAAELVAAGIITAAATAAAATAAAASTAVIPLQQRNISKHSNFLHAIGSSKDSSTTSNSTSSSNGSSSGAACWGGLRTLDTSSSSSSSSSVSVSSTVQCKPGAALVYQLQPCNSSDGAVADASLTSTQALAAVAKLSILGVAGLAQADADGLSDAFCTVHWSQPPLSDNRTFQEPLDSANGYSGDSPQQEDVTLLRTATVYVSLDPFWQDETVEVDVPSYETVAAGRGDLIIEVSELSLKLTLLGSLLYCLYARILRSMCSLVRPALLIALR
jgi:hypothetical protein